jgi:hypothetical protein
LLTHGLFPVNLNEFRQVCWRLSKVVESLKMEAGMPSVVSIQQNVQRYVLVAPEGEQIEIPKELFKALWDFSQGSKATGSVVIHFRNGGVAGLEAVIKRTYK